MSLTRAEYQTLLERSDKGEIVFFYDAAQCKDFLLRLNWVAFLAETGKSLRYQCHTIKAIVYGFEPLFLLVSMIASFAWFKWWGVLIAPAVFLIWGFLKSVSCVGRQTLAKPIMVFVAGIAVAVWFRSQGVGFVVFMLSLSSLYLTEKMLYALPFLFFSVLTRSCYELVNRLYGRPIDEFNNRIKWPIMWHVETVDGALPKQSVNMPSTTYLTLHGMFSGIFSKKYRTAFKLRYRGNRASSIDSMHSYIEIFKRLLDSFKDIHCLQDLHIRFDEGFLQKTDPKEMFDGLEYSIPVDLHMFNFRDNQGNQGSLEVCFKEGAGELINIRLLVFFPDFESKDLFFHDQVRPFFSENFVPVKFKTHPEIPVEEFHKDDLVIVLNNDQRVPLISTYITLKGFA